MLANFRWVSDVLAGWLLGPLLLLLLLAARSVISARELIGNPYLVPHQHHRYAGKST